MSASLGVLRQKLVACGRQVTPARVAIYDYLNSVTDHPRAEAVFMAVRRKLPRVSLGTIYRNLEVLVECGAASRLPCADGSARYELRTDRHHHVACPKCGQVADLGESEDLVLLRQLETGEGFKVFDYQLQFIGFCGECRGR